MTRIQWLALATAILLASGAGWFAGRNSRPAPSSEAASPSGAPARKVLYYRNPMGLPDTSPVPKKDAMGMDYIPVYEDDVAASAPGTVVLPPDKVQKLGVRTERARLRPLSSRLRVSGTVQVDETREYAIAPKFEGWIERLYANQTGMQVRRGQPLLAVYSPQVLAAREEYRVADTAARKLAASDPASAASMIRLRDAAQLRLRNWDIGGRNSGGNMELTSPADAVVVEKPVVQGARFAPGDTILRLADLSAVWIIANVPASAARDIRVGERATFESPTLPGQAFEGRVSFVQPVIDPEMRTLDVRVALPNRDGMLRPGLFGQVTLFRDDETAVLAVPRSAVLDSGTRQIVLVQVAEGRFEPRTVSVGRRSGELAEILQGVAEGESVVVAANFLIDAESNLKSALEGFGGPQGQGGDAPAASRSSADGAAPEPDAAPSQSPAPAAAPARPAPPEEHRHAPAKPPAEHDDHSMPTPTDDRGGHDMPPPAEDPSSRDTPSSSATADPHAGHTGH